jgi:hypothetical protein
VKRLSTDLGYPLSPSGKRQNLLMRRSTFRILVSSLRLLMAFILLTMNALRIPTGLLGGLPGPVLWYGWKRVCFMLWRSSLERIDAASSCFSNFR